MSGRAVVLSALAVAIACGPATGAAPPMASVNACPDHPCSAYVQNGTPATCVDGACLVTAQGGNWTLVVSLSTVAPVAPGAVYALPFAQLLGATSGALPAGTTCNPGTCGVMPSLPFPQASTQCALQGDLLVSPDQQRAAGWNLGGADIDIALPVQATFRAQWPPGSTSPSDAAAFGLPVAAVSAPNLVDSSINHAPGPAGGPNLYFCAPLLQPLVYERTLAPMPPFDAAYPPDIERLDLTASTPPTQTVTFHFDETTGTNPGGAPRLPTFDLSRVDGGALDGWQAYLRDATSYRRISNLPHLSGVQELGLQLLTSHHADALANAQLVMVPPAGAAMPTWIFTPLNGDLVGAGTYPRLPAATTVTGTVRDQEGRSVPADLVFDATDVCRFAANGAVGHDALSANHDFSFRERTAAPSGQYSAQLPLGVFRVTVIPRDATHEVTVDSAFALADPACNPIPAPDLSVDVLRTVRGTASVADGRALAGATIEVVPTACEDGSTDAPCLPRQARATTAVDGSFELGLDPGAYVLRVRPAEGSRLPWVVQPLSVGPLTSSKAPPTVVPAPVNAGMQLLDPSGNPVVEAVVRMYETPASGLPYEIGEALTDSNGHFDMYLATSGQ